MKTREQIIEGMCLTYRHDYGLLPIAEKIGVRTTMTQIYDHEIAPHMAPRSMTVEETINQTFQVAKATIEAAKDAAEVTIEHGGVKLTFKK